MGLFSVIDSHTHTKYSKHAKGNVEEIVVAAIQNNIKVLTITDHAPFYVDRENRLLDRELPDYFAEINQVKTKYVSEIKILTGLEVDFLPNDVGYLERLLADIQLDYVIGAIHYVYLNSEKVNVWDIGRLNNKIFITEYFSYLNALIQSDLFDSIAHPDTILRGGMPEKDYCDYFIPLIQSMKKTGISYELNCSWPQKSIYDKQRKTEIIGSSAYPSPRMVRELHRQGITFTIGSDAHDPADIGAGIQAQLAECVRLNINSIVYYQQRQKQFMSITDLL
jgi:histidinol-phosphatase (PHP family)